MHTIDKFTVTINGVKYKARVVHDEDTGAPWKEHDGHGPVSEWTRYDKAPGQWVLCEDNGSKRYYDAREAQKIALRDWVIAGTIDGETARQRAAKAVREDFYRLKAWCDDEWYWVGVIVTHGDEGRSIWGIESDGEDHIRELAEELAEELAGETAKLARQWDMESV